MREIIGICEHEHARLTSLMESAARALGGPDIGQANRSIESLARRLKTHFAIEEELCFPAWTTGSRAHGTEFIQSLTRDHAMICECVENAHARFSEGEFRLAQSELDQLRHLFANHVTQTENVVYPVCARVMIPGNSGIPPTERARYLNAAMFHDQPAAERVAA